MKLQNVVLSVKQTAYEHFKDQYDNVEEELDSQDLKSLIESHESHTSAVLHAEDILKSRGITYSIARMPYTAFQDFRGKDLVISLGGDGTVLNTSRYIRDSTPLLAVRSDSKSTGSLCRYEPSQVEDIIERILSDDYGIENWARMEGRVGNKTDLCLNDVFIGPKYSSGTARYNIKFNEKEEKQFSSGVVVSTGAGSTGWYKNIPGNMGTFPRTSDELRFIAREFDVDGGYELSKGVIKKGDVLEIRSRMNIDGIVSFDGDTRKRMHDFTRGKTVQIKVSDKPLKVIV